MNQSISLVTLVVRDYDEAIAFYTQKLDFELVEDTFRPAQNKRWVVVAPRRTSAELGSGTHLLLAKAAQPEQMSCVGNQAGGRVFLFLQTDDIGRDHARMLAAGVTFVRPPTVHEYGTVAVFEDLYGNRWDLLEESGSS